MRRREIYLSVGLLVVIALVLCAYLYLRTWGKSPQGSAGGAAGQAVTEEPSLEPIVPPGYQKIAPGPADNAKQMLSQTATIFRGSLKDVQFTYDACGGPRTVYVFSNGSALVGASVTPEVKVKVLGGQTTRGTWLSVSELPQLALDSDYVVFLRNTDWTFSPIVGNLVFRVETISGREVMVNPEGRAVTGWGDDGPVLTAGTVSEVVGSHHHGYRSAEPRAYGQDKTSVETDPKVEVKPTNVVGPAQAATRTEASAIASAPSAAEIRKTGMFERPALSDTAIVNEPVMAVSAFVGAIKAAAEKTNLQIGGRLALDPNWRCWSTTPTQRARR